MIFIYPSLNSSNPKTKLQRKRRKIINSSWEITFSFKEILYFGRGINKVKPRKYEMDIKKTKVSPLQSMSEYRKPSPRPK